MQVIVADVMGMCFGVRDALQTLWFAGVDRVGLTAGTFPLDETIRLVHEVLLALGETK